jgi:hypothetical protein
MTGVVIQAVVIIIVAVAVIVIFLLNEDGPFNLVSPYAVNKVYAYWAVKNFR